MYKRAFRFETLLGLTALLLRANFLRVDGFGHAPIQYLDRPLVPS